MSAKADRTLAAAARHQLFGPDRASPVAVAQGFHTGLSLFPVIALAAYTKESRSCSSGRSLWSGKSGGFPPGRPGESQRTTFK